MLVSLLAWHWSSVAKSRYDRRCRKENPIPLEDLHAGLTSKIRATAAEDLCYRVALVGLA